MDDQTVRKARPFVRRKYPGQIALDLRGIFGARETKAPRNPFAVSVDDDPRDAESMAENYVRCFSAHARQFG